MFVAAASTLSPLARAATAPVDAAFVAEVSQGGRFEAKAGEMAVERGTSAAVKAFARKDVDDHVAVNDELKAIAGAHGLPLEPALDGALQGRLDRLGRLTGGSFDRAYLDEIRRIHRKDEGIFAKEAKNAADPDWKAFAAKTDAIVKGHIADLGSID